MALTQYSTSQVAALNVFYGRFADGTVNSARYGFVAANSTCRLQITGTEAILKCGGGASQPFHFSVDGGAESNTAVSSGQITLFTGLSDTTHIVNIRVGDIYTPNNGWFTRPNCLDVTGAAPAIAADPDYGPVQLLSTATLGQVTTAPLSFDSYSSPNTTADRGAEGISIRGKAERIYVWVSPILVTADKLTLLIDGVHSVTTTVTPTNVDYRWVLLATGLDVSTEHEYTILGTDRSNMDAVMFGGTGAQFSATAVTTRKRIAVWGDSIVEGADADGSMWRTRGYVGRTCEILGALPHNRGISGNTISQVDARITSELSSIVTAPGEPDMVVIAIGRNNWGAAAANKTTYRSIVDKAISGTTSCPIVCQANWNETGGTAFWSAMNSMISDVVTEVANPRVFFVPTTSAPVLGTTHPTQAECASMATYLAPLLEPYLNPIVINEVGVTRWIYQREPNQSYKTITESGSYTNPLVHSVEHKIVGYDSLSTVQDWTPVTNLVLSGGNTWEGDVIMPEGGWYKRYARSKDINGNVLETSGATTVKMGVGILVLVAGQSNAGRMFDIYSPGTANDKTAYWYQPEESDGWQLPLGDGIIAFTDLLQQQSGLPVGAIYAAVPGSALVTDVGSGYWLNLAGTPWTSCMAAVAGAGGDFELTAWHQGEADITGNTAAGAMFDGLGTLHTRLLGLNGRTTSTHKFGGTITGSYDDGTDAAATRIRNVLVRFFTTSAGAFCLGSATDIPLADGDFAHYNGPGYEMLGVRWSWSYGYKLGVLPFGAGNTKFVTATKTQFSRFVNVRFSNTTDIEGSSGFKFSIDGGLTFIDYEFDSVVGGNTLRLELDEDVNDYAPLTISYQDGKLPDVSDPVWDGTVVGMGPDGTVHFPALPFSAAEVQVIPPPASQDTTTGKLLHFRFDEGSGIYPHNIGTVGGIGTFEEGAGYATPGRIGSGCVYLNGAFDRVNVGASNGYNVTGTKLTLMGWIKPTNVTGDYFRIIERGPVYPNLQYSLAFEQGTGKLLFDLDRSGLGSVAKSTSAIATNVWTHVAVVYDGANRIFYINGAVDNTVSTTGSITSYPGATLWLGNYQTGAALGFSGNMDDVRIYNRALTATQIHAAMFDYGSDSDPTNPVQDVTNPAYTNALDFDLTWKVLKRQRRRHNGY